MKTLIISLCKEKLSTYEFVKPLKNQVDGKVFVIDFRVLLSLKNKEKFVRKFDLVILSGTALKDFYYLFFWKKFSFLRRIKNKKIGICAGAQVLALNLGFRLRKLKRKKIGQYIYKGKKRFFLTSYLIYNPRTARTLISLKTKDHLLLTYHPEVYNELKILSKEFMKNLS